MNINHGYWLLIFMKIWNCRVFTSFTFADALTLTKFSIFIVGEKNLHNFLSLFFLIYFLFYLASSIHFYIFTSIMVNKIWQSDIDLFSRFSKFSFVLDHSKFSLNFSIAIATYCKFVLETHYNIYIISISNSTVFHSPYLYTFNFIKFMNS